MTKILLIGLVFTSLIACTARQRYNPADAVKGTNVQDTKDDKSDDKNADDKKEESNELNNFVLLDNEEMKSGKLYLLKIVKSELFNKESKENATKKYIISGQTSEEKTDEEADSCFVELAELAASAGSSVEIRIEKSMTVSAPSEENETNTITRVTLTHDKDNSRLLDINCTTKEEATHQKINEMLKDIAVIGTSAALRAKNQE